MQKVTMKLPVKTLHIQVLGYERNYQRNIEVNGVQSEVFQWSILYVYNDGEVRWVGNTIYIQTKIN